MWCLSAWFCKIQAILKSAGTFWRKKQASENVKFAGNCSGILDLVLLPWDGHINLDLVFSPYDIHTPLTLRHK